LNSLGAASQIRECEENVNEKIGQDDHRVKFYPRHREQCMVWIEGAEERLSRPFYIEASVPVQEASP
jgi:hypothetical protein